MSLKFSSLLGLLFIFGSAHAANLDLACVTDGMDHTAFKVRQVLVAQDRAVHALQISSQSAQVERVKKFAVVIEIVGGEGNEPASEAWEVLQSREFSLRKMRSGASQAASWKFVDKKNGDRFICGKNQSVRANPALSRSN